MKSRQLLVWPCLIFALLATTIFSYGCAKRKGPLYIVGFDPLWQPLNFEQNQGAINTFISAKLLQIAEMQKFRVDLVSADGLQLLPGLESGRYDAILSTLNNKDQTALLYDFSDPILQLGPVLLVAKDSNICTINDLNGKIIAISPYNNDATLLVQKVPDAIIRSYENKAIVLEQLVDHQVDAVMMGLVDAKQFTTSLFKGRVECITTPLTDQSIRLLVLKGTHSSFLRRFNHSLKDLRNK